MASNIPECPASLKQIQHYLKTAQEHDARDPVISYWARLYALQLGIKISTQQSDENQLLAGIMDWLEIIKKQYADNEAITSEVAAQAHLENYALKLFLYADKQDRDAVFNKNVVKAFYTAGIVYDILQTFGELTDEVHQNRKYAKWKAAYIHNCLKNGETPVPGPMADDDKYAGVDEGMSTIDPPAPAPTPSIGFEEPPSEFKPIDITSPDTFPTPPVEVKPNPGGFKPYIPEADAIEVAEYQPPTTDVTLSSEQITKAQKYCKWASSALLYDDTKTAIDNLQKALRLLQTGQDS